MEDPSRSPPPPPTQRPAGSEMDMLHPDNDESSALWDWAGILDFTTAHDDQFPISGDSVSPANPTIPPAPEASSESPNQASSSALSRKRDPRLACSNFLAGRVPCSCPETDAELQAEEEELAPGKKRRRTASSTAAAPLRCQVIGCEADIRELKGYHRRHRVCLRCANASSVVIDGQSKRYCQQCGKFHILTDFDEGKRSCRRKLERHNNRRRRKPCDSKNSVEKESDGDTPAEDVGCGNDEGKDNSVLNSHIAEREALLEHEGMQPSTQCSASVPQNIQNDCIGSFVGSGDVHRDRGLDHTKFSISSFYSDNRVVYSSACPTSRISFKLYDWNPAEFPRELRHQIFQWLASMPVELEGYIRPGCTILTTFIAMPKFMWDQVYKDPALYVHDIVVEPHGMLHGKGSLYVNLNDMIFLAREDCTSITKVQPQAKAPRLHYVYPICFEAGRPVEFVACASNLLQTKFRFLISFAGNYLAYEYCAPVPYSEIGRDSDCSFEHHLFKIRIAHTKPDHFGPAFIEVENESGLSNFLPILIGDGEVCLEVTRVLQKSNSSFCSKGSQLLATGSLVDSCDGPVLMKESISEFILDIAWLLKEPASENLQHLLVSSNIERLFCLLSHLLQHECITIMERTLRYMEIVMDHVKLKSLFKEINDTDIRLFQRCMMFAKDLHLKLLKGKGLEMDSGNNPPRVDLFPLSCSKNDSLAILVTDQVMEVGKDGKSPMPCDSAFLNRSELAPLLSKEIVMALSPISLLQRKSHGHFFSRKTIGNGHMALVLTTAAVCLGMCAIIYHPHRVGELAVTIRRCLFNHA